MATASKFAYVASTELPELPAPVNTRGPIAWLHQNFFSSWRDTILTILCIYLVYQVLSHLLPWLIIDSMWDVDTAEACGINSLSDCIDAVKSRFIDVWSAPSLSACRELGAGACFAVITDRWDQLVFGFYPHELYWRPIVAFLLLFLAVAPLLHENLPRPMLWFSALYPLIAYWLLWGGSIWGPLLIIAMVAIAVAIYSMGSFNRLPTFGLFGAFAFVAIWLLFVQSSLSSLLTSNINLLGLEPVESEKFGGFLITMVIGVTGIGASLPIGIMLALGRSSDMPALKMLSVGFIEFIRGVPLITLLFVASVLLSYFLPPGTVFDKILRVVIMVTLFSSAYLAEVIRGGLAALPRGQYEAADALGLNYWQATRLIVLPQALKISIPGIVNTFIGLFKDTTLVSIISVLDPVGMMQPIRSTPEWAGIIWEMPIFIGVVFFFCCITMSRYSMYFERKLDTGHRN